MPKDEFDFDDPMELNAVALACHEDTTGVMAECFIEEFMRLGYNAKQILALFRNPHYLGMNLVIQRRGEAFVRDRIAEVFARWGKPVPWTSPPTPGAEADCPGSPTADGPSSHDRCESSPQLHGDALPQTSGRVLTDPTGAAIPQFII